VQRNSEGKLHFVHRTFGEYFVADFLINQLTKKTKPDEKLQRFLLNEVLLKMDCRVIRAFLDGLLKIFQPSKEALKEYGEKLDELWNETVDTSALHEAVKEDNAHIIAFLLDSLKSGGYSYTVEKMLLDKDPEGHTALHVAAVTNNKQALKLILEWAEVVTHTFTYSLLLSKDKGSNTALHLAAEGGHTNVVENLWSWAEKVQKKPGDLHKNLLLSQNSEGRTAWHVAVQSGSLELVDKIWGWAKELLSPGWLKNKLLLYRDKKGVNAWHLAARKGNVEILSKLWGWAKELQIDPEELRNEILLSKNKDGQTA